MSLLSSTFQVARWKRTGKDKNDDVTGARTIEGSVRVNEAYCKAHYRSRRNVGSKITMCVWSQMSSVTLYQGPVLVSR